MSGLVGGWLCVCGGGWVGLCVDVCGCRCVCVDWRLAGCVCGLALGWQGVCGLGLGWWCVCGLAIGWLCVWAGAGLAVCEFGHSARAVRGLARGCPDRKTTIRNTTVTAGMRLRLLPCKK